MALGDILPSRSKPSDDAPYTEESFLKMIDDSSFVSWFNSSLDSVHYNKTHRILTNLQNANIIFGYTSDMQSGEIIPLVSQVHKTSSGPSPHI